VAENIAFGLEVRDVPRAAARQWARSAAESVGCAGLLDRRPGQLSGGERQRVALARALAREPDVFLLDEPLSHLDPGLRAEMRAELRALHDRLGATMVHVTHDQTEALVLGDRIAVLRAGRIEQVGTPDAIWRTPASTFVARFVGFPPMNLLPAVGAFAPSGPPPGGTAMMDLTMGFRAEAVTLGDGNAAVVERVEVVGEDAYVYATLAGGQPIVARVPSSRRPARGETVRAGVRWTDVHLFHTASGQRYSRSDRPAATLDRTEDHPS
jgi:ABC-type sugar transport system ATPase subunit